MHLALFQVLDHCQAPRDMAQAFAHDAPEDALHAGTLTAGAMGSAPTPASAGRLGTTLEVS